MFGYGHGSMPMPGPAATHASHGHGYGMPSPRAAIAQMPMPQASYGYAGTSYSPQPAPRPDDRMDRDMEMLIKDLKNLVQVASREELEQLLNNEDRINTLISDSEKVKQLQKNREKLIQSNKDQAVFNMSLDPDLKLKKEKLTEAVLKQSSLKEEYDQLRTKLEQLAGKFSMDTTLALLQAAMSEKESVTENMSEQLINNELEVEKFLENYITERKNYHERRIKSEKMTDFLRNGQFQQQGQSYYPTGYGRY